MKRQRPQRRSAYGARIIKSAGEIDARRIRLSHHRAARRVTQQYALTLASAPSSPDVTLQLHELSPQLSGAAAALGMPCGKGTAAPAEGGEQRSGTPIARAMLGGKAPYAIVHAGKPHGIGVRHR